MTLFIDTETTGLFPNAGADLVEVAIINDAGAVLLDTLVNPGRPIPPEVTRIHGITNAMVVDAMSAGEARRKVLDLVADHDLVAYNAEFDTSFFPGIERSAASIKCAMRRFAETWPERAWREDRGEWKLQKLSIAAAYCGHDWSGAGAHRALADAMACRSVWCWLESQGCHRSQARDSGVIVLRHA